MGAQNAPGINQTRGRVCCFIACFAMLQSIYLRESWSAAFGANDPFSRPSPPLPTTDFVTIKANQYLISNMVLSPPCLSF